MQKQPVLIQFSQSEHYRNNTHRIEKETLLLFLFHIYLEKNYSHQDINTTTTNNSTLHSYLWFVTALAYLDLCLFIASEQNRCKMELTLLLSFQVCFRRLQWRMLAFGRWFHGSDAFMHYVTGVWSCVLSSFDVNLSLFTYLFIGVDLLCRHPVITSSSRSTSFLSCFIIFITVYIKKTSQWSNRYTIYLTEQPGIFARLSFFFTCVDQ